MIRRFVIVVFIFLVVVVIAADRVGALVAGHVLATKLESDENLPDRPSVTIGGIPFLTQVANGKYTNVTVTAHEVPVHELSITTLTVHLHGVRIPLSHAFHGTVSQVPVDRVTGTAFISFADANRYLSRHLPSGLSLKLAPGSSGGVTVIDQVDVGGHSFTLKGSGSVALSGGGLTVSVGGLKSVGGIVAQSVINAAISAAKIVLPANSLPFRFRLASVRATATGLIGTGVATNVVLGGSG